MCLPGCQETVLDRLSRRRFFKGAGAATLAVSAGGAASTFRPAAAQAPRQFERAIDLTHTMGENFPTFFGEPNLEMERLVSLEDDGYNMFRWLLVEHTGTHMDAPIHFSNDGNSADEIPVEQLVVPLAVIDIRARAAEDPDAQLTPDDIASWEAENGELPENACVAMNSGWDSRVGSSEQFRNPDADGVMHFPGFHVETTEMLAAERSVAGIAVDTLSLDFGQSPDFAVHYQWLPTNRWGIEAIANLGELPASGATLVVGGPKIRGATGGPSRVIALV